MAKWNLLSCCPPFPCVSAEPSFVQTNAAPMNSSVLISPRFGGGGSPGVQPVLSLSVLFCGRLLGESVPRVTAGATGCGGRQPLLAAGPGSVPSAVPSSLHQSLCLREAGRGLWWLSWVTCPGGRSGDSASVVFSLWVNSTRQQCTERAPSWGDITTLPPTPLVENPLC